MLQEARGKPQATAAAVHVGVAAAGPAAPLQREEAAAVVVEIVDDSEGGEEEEAEEEEAEAEEAAGSLEGAGVALSDVEIPAVEGQSSLGPAGVDQGAAPSSSSSSSSSSSVVMGSSAATVASAVTAEGPPPLPTAPEPAAQQSAGVVGPTQLAELEALVARSIRDADAGLGEMAD